MIKRFTAIGYKSLADRPVELRPLTVLLGPNAVGKSNFLDAIQLLARMVSSRTLKEAFDPPCRGTPLESFAFGPDGIAGHMKKESLQLSFEVDVELSPQTVQTVEKLVVDMRQKKDDDGEGKPRPAIREKLLRYRLTVEIVPRSGILRVADESLSALKENGDLKASRNPFIEKKDHRLHLRLEGQAHPIFHEIGLDHTIISRPLYPPHYPHLVALRTELESWFCFYFEPRERMRAATPVKEVRHIGLMGEDLAAFLNTLQANDERQFQGIRKAVHALIPRIDDIKVSVSSLGEVELCVREDGVAVPARLVSEGTLRMLGLLAVGASKERPTVVAFEEPENGVHPRRIELIARFLQTQAAASNTQFIVTTHSPVLAEQLSNDCLFVVSRLKGKTIIQPYAEVGPLFRQNQIGRSLEDPTEGAASVSERWLRGDFDGQ